MEENNRVEWGTLIPLGGTSLPEWPQGLFPEPFESFIRELARSTETPIEMSTMLTLAAVAACIHKTYQVRIKPDYCEPLNIWVLPVLPPASRKSAVFSRITAPLREWETERRAEVESKIKSAESQRKTMEVRLKELRQKAAKANEVDYQSFQSEIELLESSLPEVPICPRIWAADVTSEQLGVLMAIHGDGMTLLSDEGGIFDILSGLYSEGRTNIDLCLQAHSASPVRVDRGSRPPITMQRPVLTVGITVQPQVLQTICSNKTFRGKGLLARFLYVFPKSNIGERLIEVPSMAAEYSLRFDAAMRSILSNTIDGEFHTLQFSKEAFEKWLEWAKAIEIMMSDDMGYLSHVTDWAGKLAGAMARIAGILHIMRNAERNAWEHPVTLEDMEAAAKMINVLIKHSLKVFDLAHESPEDGAAQLIQRWIISERLEKFTARECSRRFRAIKKGLRDGALKLLEEHEVVKLVDVSSSLGRPSEVYVINPLLFLPAMGKNFCPFCPYCPEDEEFSDINDKRLCITSEDASSGLSVHL